MAYQSIQKNMNEMYQPASSANTKNGMKQKSGVSEQNTCHFLSIPTFVPRKWICNFGNFLIANP